MFRIRRIHDSSLPVDQRELDEVQRILRERLPGVSEEEVASLPDRLRDPLAHRLQARLYVADDLRGHLRGFALVSYAPDVNFCFLDFIATGDSLSQGLGGALYQHIREAALALGVPGLFFECLPDDPEAVSDPAYLPANAARLRFYERFGARPLVGIGYELPLRPGQKDLPYLVYDDLGRGTPPARGYIRAVVQAVLERKYADLCSPEYVARVLECIQDDPARVRPPRYASPKAGPPRVQASGEGLVVLVVNDKHDIHHVRERGYVESPVRVRSILDALQDSGLFWREKVRYHSKEHVLAVHDRALVDYLQRACKKVGKGKSVYPYVFPIRNAARPPKDLAVRAGYFCIDTFTPINGNAWPAARRAVDAALTAADALLGGQRLAYALVRPPGHHAERRAFGGFCYFNNAAVAAHYLSERGKVAILDLDYHHGNGQQDIFYERADVLTISIHGAPEFAYPYFSGFADEEGEGPGLGFNLNIPLPERVDGRRYRIALDQALERLRAFAPRFLVVCLGLDTAKRDPTGTWSLGPDDFRQNGAKLGALGLPTLVVQEGGYRTLTLGKNALEFFRGLTGR